MTAFFNLFFYNPIFNLLVWLYNVIPGSDLGLAVVVITVALRLALWPLTKKSILAQKHLSDLQPKQAELKIKYKDNKEKLMQETLKLYQENKVNPLSSCLPLLIQLPFLLALYWALQNITSPDSLAVLYSFVPNPGTINLWGLWGWLDMSKPSVLLAVMAAAAQFWQGWMLSKRRPPVHSSGSKDEELGTMINQQMTYVMPVVTLIISLQFAAGLALYWFLSTFLMAVQQWYYFRSTDDSNRPTIIEAQIKPAE